MSFWEMARKFIFSPLKYLLVVMTMGFSSLDARLALRACSGDVQRAVQMIINKKEEEAEMKRKELADRRKQQEARVLGRTADGQWWVWGERFGG
jgi:uncharacterized UBP type Zn finger protein